ncbi:hypothetical protein DDZ14_18805 [Maritimibacter sp. 55A14]|uniref:hypothetical protein n=1 Tax=Maritimibacter sp. 55A14 TaxID=2174844 RepID=UPI000D61EEB1|nr:hypothetical protein [Maritimibacter sp. 55A14]PWE28758.1 hypothetical protein DDZ14_18805 [Maritimibacter sp. 55A14]
MIDPRHSRPLDVHRWSDHPEVNGLVDRVWEEHFRDFHARASGPKPKLRFRDQLKVVLLDLYVAWATDPDLAVGVSLSANAWRTGSRYNALHLSKVIVTFIHRLDEVGLIDLSLGSYSGPAVKSNRSSRIRAAEPLRELFARARFEPADIDVAEGRETVILRSGDGGGGAAKQIEYEDNETTVEMRELLEDYNSCLSSHFIDLPQLDRPFVERRIRTGPREGEVQRIPVGPTNAFVRRVFSRGDWSLNGRFYGGWWQQIDKETRSTILIDDVPSVEVDFRGLHVAILSKEKGVPLTDDPYLLPAGLLPGVAPAEQRGFVKRLVLTAINAAGEKAAYAAFREGYPKGSPGKALTNQSLGTLIGAFLRKHPHLEDCLFSDQGIRLMNVDGRIASEIVEHFTHQWVPVLCIHDSFVVSHERTLELIDVMRDVTARHLGGPLAVTQDFPGLDQFMASAGGPTEAAYRAIRSLPERSRGYIHRRDRFFEKMGRGDHR